MCVLPAESVAVVLTAMLVPAATTLAQRSRQLTPQSAVGSLRVTPSMTRVTLSTSTSSVARAQICTVSPVSTNPGRLVSMTATGAAFMLSAVVRVTVWVCPATSVTVASNSTSLVVDSVGSSKGTLRVNALGLLAAMSRICTPCARMTRRDRSSSASVAFTVTVTVEPSGAAVGG